MSSSASNRLKPVIAHPNDVCTCGHIRAKHHVNWTESPLCAVPCVHYPDCQEEHCSGYADSCTKFVLAKTALQAAADDLTIPEGQDENELCGCGHAALVHARGAGNCLALGTSSQEDSHCLEFRPQAGYCGVCPHGGQDHNRRGECRDTTCACALAFEGEDDHVAEQTEAWEAAPEALPQVLPQPVPAYRVIYATAGGTLHAIDVPYGVNVSVIDGQLRLWHAGIPILAIQANITSTEEPR